MKNGNDLVVACTQEAPLFGELHGELKGTGAIQFVNIRETAGWSAEAARATPKIAALLALADLPEPEPVPVVSYQSAGELLIVGPAARALPWAEQLAGELSVSVLLTESTRGGGRAAGRAPLPGLVRARSRAIKGYLGAFEVEWEQANPIDLEVCTRCNACIQRLSRAGDRLLVPDRPRQVQGAPQVRDGVRRHQGDRFRARRNRAAATVSISCSI